MKILKNNKKYFLSCFLFFLCFLLIKTTIILAQKENLNVLERWIEWSDGKNMLIHHLNKQAFGYLDLRDKEISELKTKVDWLKRQEKVKEILMKIVGPFPEKTPLNSRVTGVVKKDWFRIEKVIYESMPNFYVTACLFIPEGIVGKRPAVIQVSGHTRNAFRGGSPTMILNFVKKGFIVFAIDPISQGERVQYWDLEKKEPVIKGLTDEHSYFGNQCFISGVSPGRYFTWDGIRGVDYLLTRSEVDPERIGIFGCSGGGTQTTYIAAFDERIKAAVPGCYITGFRRLLESIGPQDAEQNFYHGVSNGITHADLLELRAPKPLLISSTTRDYFSIQGAVETFEEVKRAYKAFGKEENIGQAVGDAGHGFNGNTEAIYAFFQKVLDLPPPENPIEENVKIALAPEDLQVTPTGQIASSLGGETVFSINKVETQRLIEKIEESRKNIKTHLDMVIKKAKELSGYAIPYGENNPVFRGRYQRDGYCVEMYALQGEGDYVVPLLLFIPHNGGKFPAVIYIHPEGKSADAPPGGKIEQLVRKGYIVAAPDVIGTGETAGGNIVVPRLGIYAAELISRSFVGIQAGDIVRVVNFLKNRSDVEAEKICAVAVDEICPVLLHAATFEKSITRVALLGSLISYRSMVMNKFYTESDFLYAVSGALTAYDLPDLTGCIAPRKLVLAELKDQMNQPASKTLIDEELAFPRSVYSFENVSENFKVLPSYENLSSIIDWCFE